ncbi:MAG: hypothetical protein HYS17_04080 [Micavibrio aeruginosavorus]|uniref:Uncharacterized protein n=1 Tax=Micavibrio aeruginosavorus TaxID=349221 RepID=A0A7T5R3M6_9BACT|nr:MAG: hypothetical protein HYS17_04080 [Micavibrio aeruginosavorus]
MAGNDIIANRGQQVPEFSEYLTYGANHISNFFNWAADAAGQVVQFTSPMAAAGWAAFGTAVMTYALMRVRTHSGASRNEALTSKLFNTHRGTFTHSIACMAMLASTVFATSMTAYNYVGYEMQGSVPPGNYHGQQITVERSKAAGNPRAIVEQRRFHEARPARKRELVDPFADYPAQPARQADSRNVKADPFKSQPQ